MLSITQHSKRIIMRHCDRVNKPSLVQNNISTLSLSLLPPPPKDTFSLIKDVWLPLHLAGHCVRQPKMPSFSGSGVAVAQDTINLAAKRSRGAPPRFLRCWEANCNSTVGSTASCSYPWPGSQTYQHHCTGKGTRSTLLTQKPVCPKAKKGSFRRFLYFSINKQQYFCAAFH